MSLAIELGRLGFSLAIGYAHWVVDVDDVLLNAVGAGLGCLAYRLLAHRRQPTCGPGDV